MKQNAKKNVPLVKQNVMKLEVFIKTKNSEEKKGMGEREKREDRDREKRQKGNELRISRETSTLASACCSASSRHLVPD